MLSSFPEPNATCQNTGCKKKFYTTRTEGQTARRFCSTECQQHYNYLRRRAVLRAAGIQGQPKPETVKRKRKGKWIFIPQPDAPEDF